MLMAGMTPGPSHMIEIRVRFGETDPYGVAYFAAILDYFKRGMDEFFRSRGISPDLAYRNRERNFGLPVVATQCRYRAPVRFDDLLTLRTRVARVEKNGVTVVGETNLPSEMAFHSSQLYARNVASLLGLMIKEGGLKLDFADEIIAGACVTKKETK